MKANENDVILVSQDGYLRDCYVYSIEGNIIHCIPDVEKNFPPQYIEYIDVKQSDYGKTWAMTKEELEKAK